MRQLRALLQEHSAHSRVSPSSAKPLVLLSLQELRVAALPLVGSLLWDPAYKTALGWGKDALQVCVGRALVGCRGCPVVEPPAAAAVAGRCAVEGVWPC